MNELVTKSRFIKTLGGSLENALVEYAIKCQQMLQGFTTTEFLELEKIAEK